MKSNFFSRGLTKVNFCENDFTYYKNIGEPFNVITSFIIALAGVYGLYLLNKNSKEYCSDSMILYKNDATILYKILVFIGLSSVYFHQELSPFSHWIDIISISLILVLALYFLEFNKNVLNKIKFILLFLMHLLASIYIPSILIYIQFVTGFLIQKKITLKLFLYKNSLQSDVKKSYYIISKEYDRIKLYFGLGILFWIIDYIGCEYITPLHFHWIFHIFISIVSFQTIYFVRNFYY